jgi:hypothetical protein
MKSHPAKTKKPYTKPEIRKVQLKPDEAVLGNCKNTGIVGPAAYNCNPGTQCSTLSS